jgi:uncharacterized membrane protein
MTVKPGWARKHPSEARKLPSAAQKPRGEPESGDRSIWDLNRDEQRIMMITVVGGLASIILGAFILGMAIGLVRLMNAHPHASTYVVDIIGFALFGVFMVSVVSIFAAVRKIRSGKVVHSRSPWQVFPRTTQVSAVVLVLLVCLVVLAVLGVAAAIK